MYLYLCILAHDNPIRCLIAIPPLEGKGSANTFVPMPIYRNSDGFTVLDEMASTSEMKIALAGQKAGLVTAQPLMPPPPPTGRNLCPNCGARLEGTFCGQCGTRAA